MNKKLLKQIAIFLVAYIAVIVLTILDNTLGFVLGCAIWAGAYALFDHWFEEKKKDDDKKEED